MNTLVIKLGGVLLDDNKALSKIFFTIGEYKKYYKRDLIVVHGGGCVVNDLMKKLSLPILFHDGLRVTTKDHIDIIVGALAGIANKTLLAEAKKHKISFVGLSLSDGNSAIINQLSQELECVGKASKGDASLLNVLMNNHYLPIISSIGITEDGDLMNVNADHAAIAVAQTLDADLVFLSDVGGVLDQNKQRIESLTESQAESLIKDGVIRDGMVVKVRSSFEASRMLNRSIDIASWKEEFDDLIKLFNGLSIGTKITT